MGGGGSEAADEGANERDDLLRIEIWIDLKEDFDHALVGREQGSSHQWPQVWSPEQEPDAEFAVWT
jgi:hypothetical protein